MWCVLRCMFVCRSTCVHLSMEASSQLFPIHVFRVSHWAWGEGSLNWQLVCQWAPGLRLSQPLQRWDYRSQALCGGARAWCLCGNYSTLLLVAVLFAVPRGVLTFHLVVNGWLMVSEHSHVFFFHWRNDVLVSVGAHLLLNPSNSNLAAWLS